MVSIGERGYLDAARRILETGAKIRDGIARIPGVRVLGDPLWVIAFAAEDGLDVFQVLENMGGDRFADASAAAGLDAAPLVNGRGVAVADYDNDGRVDIGVNTIGGKLILLHNTGATGHWLGVSLAPLAPGALVTAVLPDGRRLVREVDLGSSYLSSEDPRVHFGLGDATKLKELIVRLPGGKVTRRTGVAADRIVTLRTP
jgi:hypothetical protein